MTLQELFQSIVSIDSRLRILANDYTELDPHSLKRLQAAVERNVGQIQDD